MLYKKMKERNKEKKLTDNIINSGWVKIPIGNIIIFEYGKGLISTKRNRIGNVPVFGSNGTVGFHSSALVNKPCLIIGRKGAAGAMFPKANIASYAAAGAAASAWSQTPGHTSGTSSRCSGRSGA